MGSSNKHLITTSYKVIQKTGVYSHYFAIESGVKHAKEENYRSKMYMNTQAIFVYVCIKACLKIIYHYRLNAQINFGFKWRQGPFEQFSQREGLGVFGYYGDNLLLSLIIGPSESQVITGPSLERFPD